MDGPMHDSELVHLIYNRADVNYRLLSKLLVTTLRVDCSHHVCQSLRANMLLHKVDLVTFFEAVYDPGQLLNFAELLESFDTLLKGGSSALISLQDVVLHR